MSQIPDFIKDNTILQGVLKKLITQTEKGIAKYGNTVSAEVLSMVQWIDHAQEEIIDLLVYLETIKAKIVQATNIEDIKRGDAD